MNTAITATTPDAREHLLAQWRTLRAENPRDCARVFDEATATTAITAALRVAEVIGDRECDGYIAYGVPSSYTGDAWSDAIEIKHAGGEVTLRVIRRGAVRNAWCRAGLCLALKVRGKGAREVDGLAREAFAATKRSSKDRLVCFCAHCVSVEE